MILFRIGLTTDKPIPPEDIAHALETIRSIKASLTNLINILKPLINDANIALRITPRPACSVDCRQGCTGGSMCYQDVIETFDKVIKAGGPMCFLQTPNPRLLPTCYSHLQIPSKANACPSSPEHDHLHITNSHRILLENMQSQIDRLRVAYSTLAVYNWTIRNIPLRLDGKKQRSQDLNILRILEDWNNISKVRSEYEWVWGGPDYHSIGSWEDFGTACKEVAEMDGAGIGEFNLMILIKHDLICAPKPTGKRKKRSWSIESKPPASALYPGGRRSISTSPRPKPDEDSHERCEGCDENIEIPFGVCDAARAAAEATKRPEGPEHSKPSKPLRPSRTPPNPDAECATVKPIEGMPLYNIPREFEQVFARVMKMVTKPEVLTDETGRFTTKAKGKWRCEEGVSAEEEAVLYNRDFAPKAKVLCNWCREQKRIAENAADVIRRI